MAEHIRVFGDGSLVFRSRTFRCALGRTGIAGDKREGDGHTPAGRFPLRRVLYRPDRVAPPLTALPADPLRPDMGWCDDPDSRYYNRPVILPCPARHELLWRDDRLYDVIVVVGHNDRPPVPHRGSAIFLHVARPDWGFTEGCVALALPDLLAVLAGCGPETRIEITA